MKQDNWEVLVGNSHALAREFAIREAEVSWAQAYSLPDEDMRDLMAQLEEVRERVLGNPLAIRCLDGARAWAASILQRRDFIRANTLLGIFSDAVSELAQGELNDNPFPTTNTRAWWAEFVDGIEKGDPHKALEMLSALLQEICLEMTKVELPPLSRDSRLPPSYHPGSDSVY